MFVTEEFLHGEPYSRTFMLLLCVNVMVGVIISRKALGNKTFFQVSLDEGGESDLWMLFALPCGVLGALASVIFVRLTLRIKRFYADIYSEKYDLDTPWHIRCCQTIFEPQYRPFWAGVLCCVAGVFCSEFLSMKYGVFFSGTHDIEDFLSKDFPIWKSLLFFIWAHKLTIF